MKVIPGTQIHIQLAQTIKIGVHQQNLTQITINWRKVRKNQRKAKSIKNIIKRKSENFDEKIKII